MSFAFGINTTFGIQSINESFKNYSELALKKFSHPLELYDFLLILRVSLLICSISFNFVVIYVMLRSRKTWKNISSFLVFHLSLIHVFLYFLLPISSSISPAFYCKAEEFVKHIFSAAIIGTLAGVAGDRYRNIVQPFKSLAPRRLKTLFFFILGIWLFASVAATPVFFTIQLTTEEYYCRKTENGTAKVCYTFTDCHWPSKGKLPKTMYFFLAFLLPFILTLLTYIKAALSLWKRTNKGAIHSAVAKHKAKTVRLMVIAVCIFALGWGPKLFIDCLRAYNVFINLPLRHLYTLREACDVAESLSSCLNPILYAFFSPDFRKLCNQFCCCCCRHCPTCFRHRRFCLNSVHPTH